MRGDKDESRWVARGACEPGGVKPCIVCGTPTNGSRCPAHERARERARVRPAYRRAYLGTEYRAFRAKVKAGGYACRYCGQRATTVDHDPPLVQGGSDGPWRWFPACATCNGRKGAR